MNASIKKEYNAEWTVIKITSGCFLSYSLSCRPTLLPLVSLLPRWPSVDRSLSRRFQTFIYAVLESAVNYCHEYPRTNRNVVALPVPRELFRIGWNERACPGENPARREHLSPPSIAFSVFRLNTYIRLFSENSYRSPASFNQPLTPIDPSLRGRRAGRER